MKQQSIITGLRIVLISVVLMSCHSNDDKTLGEVVQTTENPNFYLLIKDGDGNNLMSQGSHIEAYNEANGEAVAFHQEHINGNDYLVLTPAAPYHDAWDDEYVYTLNPTTTVCINDARFSLQRLFDYDLQRYQATDGSRAVKVDYYPVSTFVNDMLMQSDTATIVVSESTAYLYREDYRLKVEIRFPRVPDEQQADSMMKFRLLHEGLAIARPHEQWTFGQVAGADSTYSALRVEFPLPFYYDGYDQSQWFSFHYLMTSPLLFGNKGEHRFTMQMSFFNYSQTKTTMFIYGMMADQRYVSRVEETAYGSSSASIVHQEESGKDILLYFNWNDIYL